MDLNEFKRLFLKYQRVMIVSFLIVTLGSLAYVTLVTPVYEADCKLLITEDSTSSVLGDLAVSDITLGTIGKTDPVQTQMEILQTRPILQQVIQLNALTAKNGKRKTVKSFRKELDLKVLHNTNIISIAYRNKDPELASNVVNTLAQVFVAQNKQFNKEELQAAKEFISNQLEQQQKNVAYAEEAVLLFQNNEKTISLEHETIAKVDSLVDLETSLMEIESQLEGTNAQQQDIMSKTRKPGASSNPLYQEWMKSLEEIENRVANLSAMKRKVTNQIGALNFALKELPPKEIELSRLLRDKKMANEIYTSLLAKFEEVKINEAATMANIKLIEPAVQPEKPVFPKKGILLLVSAAVGLALGFILAVTLEYLSESPASIEETTSALPYPLLGRLPESRDKTAFYVRDNPRSSISESFRLIVTNLKFRGIGLSGASTIMVTSAVQGEGKTTVSANLAATFAAAGKKTALVNLDLRAPSFDKYFDVIDKKGIADYLSGNVSLESIMFDDAPTGLTVVPAGRTLRRAGLLTVSTAIPYMVKHLKDRFDIIIFDSAPVTMVADTLDAATHMDGIILVADISGTAVTDMHQLRDLLHDKNLPILGLVINRLTSTVTDYRSTEYYYRPGLVVGA